MADDRDIRRTKTPPAGVRAQTAPPEGEFEEDELTPIYGDAVSQTQRRATQAAVSGRKNTKLLAEVRKELSAYAASDQKDHSEMKEQFQSGIAEVKTDIAEVKSDLKQITEHVGDMRPELAKVSGQLEVIVSNFELEQQNAAHAQRIKLKYTYSVKEGIWKTALKIIGAGGAAIAAGVAGYYIAHWLHISM